MDTTARRFFGAALLLCLAPLPVACSEDVDDSTNGPEMGENQREEGKSDDQGDESDGDQDQDESDEGGGDNPPSEAGSCTFEAYNYLAFGSYLPDIYLAYLSPTSAPSWGPNLLDGVMEYGGGIRITNVPRGSYDAQMVDEDGDTYSLYGVVCDGGTKRWGVVASDID